MKWKKEIVSFAASTSSWKLCMWEGVCRCANTCTFTSQSVPTSRLSTKRIVWFIHLPSGILPKVFDGQPSLETFTFSDQNLWLTLSIPISDFIQLPHARPLKLVNQVLQCMNTANQRWLGSFVHLFHTIYTKMTKHVNENTLAIENT